MAKLPVLPSFFRPAATQYYEGNAVGGAATVSCQDVANCRQFGLKKNHRVVANATQASMLAVLLCWAGKREG